MQLEHPWRGCCEQSLIPQSDDPKATYCQGGNSIAEKYFSDEIRGFRQGQPWGVQEKQHSAWI